MTTNELIRKIVLRAGKFKWVIVLGCLGGAVGMFFYSKTIPIVYYTKATVFPLNASAENTASSALSTLLGGSDPTKSFSQDASINIVELAISRNTREAVVMERLPQMGNMRIAELLINNYNLNKKIFQPALKTPKDSMILAAVGAEVLRENFSAKILKSGIMEIADIFVVNKCDREGADAFANHLKKLAHYRMGEDQWEIPVIQTMATDSRGIQALSDAIDLHQKLGISTHRKEQLLAEKAYRLIQRNRMKNLGIEALKQEIAIEIQAGTFNLYRFAKKHY
jgi:hypothetical protein